MANRHGPFGPGLMEFLRELDRHNERAWFERNKQRYEDEVRGPALDLIHAMAPRLEKISPHLTANDRKTGGSLMRVHRDVRFSKDKRPFKTNLGIQFRHEAGRDVHAPGLYVHVDPNYVFLGAGMWHPDAPSLAAVRAAIDEDRPGWKQVRDRKRFREHWELAGESLRRPPRGYTAEHPLIEDLKRKDYIALCTLQAADVTRTDLISFLGERFTRAKGFLAWLSHAVGMPF